MPTEPGVAAIAHVIQLSIAPVFLLSGVSAMLARRARLESHAISLGTICAMLICALGRADGLGLRDSGSRA